MLNSYMDNSICSPTKFAEVAKAVADIGTSAEIKRAFIQYCQNFGRAKSNNLLEELRILNNEIYG